MSIYFLTLADDLPSPHARASSSHAACMMVKAIADMKKGSFFSVIGADEHADARTSAGFSTANTRQRQGRIFGNTGERAFTPQYLNE